MSKVIEIAKSQIGVCENPKGSNSGKEVNEYLKSVGINFPAPWCMAFVYWCFKQAGIVGLAKTGGVLDQWNKCKQYQIVNQPPQPGDILIMDFGKGLGHTAIVESYKDGVIKTIEGNSNNEKGREGFIVCQHERFANNPKIKGYLRIV
jgi:CHAP domain